MTDRNALVSNAADAGQVRDAKRKEKSGREQLLADFRSVLSTPQGRRVFWHLIGHCGPHKSTYDDIPFRMAHNAGRQDVGSFLLHEITEAQPDAYLQMMQEARDQEKRNG